jgi:hypothetical protein
MDVLSALPNVTRAKLEACNRVRLFYGVFFLSEITTADGGSIARDAWDGSGTRFSPLLWPFQPTPGPKSFRVWRRLLTDAFLCGPHLRINSRTLDLALRNTVGRWLPASASFRFQWETFYAPSAY